MKKPFKGKTDELDKGALYNRIIILESNACSDECPYPDILSREIDAYCQCEICDEETREECAFFQENVQRFMLDFDYLA